VRNFLIFLLFFIFDRVTKYWALLSLKDHDINIYSSLNFHLSWNRGISWGVFGNSSSLGFSLLTAFIALVIILFVIYTVDSFRYGNSVFFEVIVLSGAISNFFDRIYYGAVIDFIDINVLGWHWPTFNVADACIVVGIVGVILKGLLWALPKK